MSVSSYGLEYLSRQKSSQRHGMTHQYMFTAARSCLGDRLPNPGPNYKFPCGICDKPCRSNQNCIACDSCDLWFHVKCMNMSMSVFRGTHNVNWICSQCGVPYYCTTLFDTTRADSLRTENSYNSLAEAGNPNLLASDSPQPARPSLSTTRTSINSPSGSSIGSPIHTSSPNKANPRLQLQNTMRILVINFQSIRAKKTPFRLLMIECNPDLIIGSET